MSATVACIGHDRPSGLRLRQCCEETAISIPQEKKILIGVELCSLNGNSMAVDVPIGELWSACLRQHLPPGLAKAVQIWMGDRSLSTSVEQNHRLPSMWSWRAATSSWRIHSPETLAERQTRGDSPPPPLRQCAMRPYKLCGGFFSSTRYASKACGSSQNAVTASSYTSSSAGSNCD